MVEDKIRMIVDSIDNLNKEVREMRHENFSDHKEIRKNLAALDTRTAVLEVKSGLWGTIGGLMVVGFAVVVSWVKGLL